MSDIVSPDDDGGSMARDRSSAAGGRPKGGPRRDLMEREFLDRAAELFAERGFAATSVQDIADAAGVGRTTLYHYFRSKDDFLSALVEDVTIAAAHELRELLAHSSVGPGGQLHQIAEALVTRQLARAVRFRVLDREEHHLPPAQKSRHQMAKRAVLEKVSDTITAGIASGEFNPVDPHIAALSLIGMCNWTAWWFKPDAKKTAREVATLVADLAVNALRRPERESIAGSPQAIIAGIRTALNGLERDLSGMNCSQK